MKVPSDSPPAPLDYSTPGLGCRVQYSQSAVGTTIVIPSPAGRRVSAAVGTVMAIAADALCNEFGLFLGAIVAFALWSGEFRRQFLFAGAALSVIVVVLFVCAWLYHRRLDDPMVVEVTSDALNFLNLNARERARSFPRNLVYDIKYVTHSRLLVVRARGTELFEWRPVDDDAEIQQMVELLRDAVGLGPADETT